MIFASCYLTNRVFNNLKAMPLNIHYLRLENQKGFAQILYLIRFLTYPQTHLIRP